MSFSSLLLLSSDIDLTMTRVVDRAKKHFPMKNLRKTSSDDSTSTQVDPLGPYTPEADAALQEARDARGRSSMLRRQAQNSIANAENVQQGMHNSVNNGLTTKVAETASLKVCIMNMCFL